MSRRIIAVLILFSSLFGSVVYAKTIVASVRLGKTGTPTAQENPPCTAVAQAKNIAEALKDQAGSYAGKAVSAVIGTNDPFKVRKLNQSTCADLCVIIPAGSDFTAEGSISDPQPWRGPLAAGLPEVIRPGNWAALEGPIIEDTEKGRVVCYTAKNWKHDADRLVGISVTYDQ